MPSDKALPAAELRLAEDARFTRLQNLLLSHESEDMICCPESCWCWEVRAIIDEHDAARASSPRTLEEDALLLLLWHHQGAQSEVGQAIRKILGMGQFDRMTAEQIAHSRALAEAQKGGAK